MSIDCLSLGILFADIACHPIGHLPFAGELVPTKDVSLHLGGCAANVAIDLAKLDHEVGIAGCVGDDAFGEFIASSLRIPGVDTGGIHRLPDICTAATMMVNVEGEDRRFISTPGANTKFTAGHIPTAWLEEAKVIYIGGYLVMPELETPEFVELLRQARSRGAKVVLDIVLFGGRAYKKILDQVLPEVDVFLPNDDESTVVTGVEDPVEQAKRFRDAGAKCVVVTCGEKGSVLVSDDNQVRSGVYPVDFVGGAGSGDAFDAGYIAGLLRGEDELGCLRWGSAVGASSVRGVSTTGSVFTLDEAEQFMAENELAIEEL